MYREDRAKARAAHKIHDLCANFFVERCTPQTSKLGALYGQLLGLTSTFYSCVRYKSPPPPFVVVVVLYLFVVVLFVFVVVVLPIRGTSHEMHVAHVWEARVCLCSMVPHVI